MIWPGLGGVAGMAEPWESGVRLEPAWPPRKRPGPDTDSRDLRPAERAEEDGRGRLGGEAKHDRHIPVLGLVLVLLLQGGKDPQPPRGLGRGRMDREAHLALHAVEDHAQEGVRGDSCNLPA